MNEIFFDHEKLKVYQKSTEFVAWVNKILKGIKIKSSTNDQLDRAVDSIALNIAEGNGKFSGRDKYRFFDISRGSAFESASCLDLLFSKNLITSEIVKEGKEQLREIVSMLMGLIKSNSNRVYESEDNYSS